LFEIDQAHSKLDIYKSKLVFDVWNDKYRWRDEKTPQATFERVVNAIYQNDNDDARREAYYAMSAGLWVPGGRIIAGAGTPKRVTFMNCLGGETEFYTKEHGVKQLRELVGKQATVLTKDGWRLAEVKCFGLQPLNTIVFAPSRSNRRRKVVRATSDHRWVLSTGIVTTALKIGMKLPHVSTSSKASGKNIELDFFMV
jgi:hypothetical protein